MSLFEIIEFVNKNSGAFLVVFTGVYAFFTYLLFLKNRDIYESTLRPLPIITFNRHDEKFEIENIGNGVAVSIIFEEYDIFWMDVKKHYNIVFKDINILRPKQREYLEQKNGDFPTVFIAYPNKLIKIKFFFRDIVGGKYYGVIQLGTEQVFVSHIIRRNLFNDLRILFDNIRDGIETKYLSYQMKKAIERK